MIRRHDDGIRRGIQLHHAHNAGLEIVLLLELQLQWNRLLLGKLLQNIA